MANFSFGLSGATPKQTFSTGASSLLATTPAAKALSGAAISAPKPPSPQSSFSTSLTNLSGQTPGVLHAAPATPVKSQTTTHPDGSSTQTTYHSPTTAVASESSKQAQSSGVFNPNYEQQTNVGVSPIAPTFPGILSTVVQQGSQPSQLQNSAAGIAQKAADTYNTLNTELAQSRKNEANAEAENRLNPIPIGDQTGREAVIRGQYLAQQNALASRAQGATNLFSPALSTAASTQGQQFGAAQNAASLAQPLQVSPGNYLASPVTGQGLAGGLQQGLMNLTTLGQAQGNINLGQGFQAQAAPLDASLKQLDALTPAMTSFMSSVGLNPNTAPYANSSIQAYLSQYNPGAIATWNAMIGDFKTYTGQILGESGLTPTEVTDITNSLDPSKLTGADLAAFAQNISSLGQIRLAALQNAAQSSFGANSQGNGAFVGTPAPAQATLQPTAQTPGSFQGQGNQQLIGAGLQALGGIGGLFGGITSFVSHLFGK